MSARINAERELIEQTIIKEMHRYADAMNLHENFKKGIELELVNHTKNSTSWRIKNTWRGKRGQPLARFFEKGTKRKYLIEPIRFQPPKKRLWWFWKPTGAWLLHWFRNGRHYYRRRVIHPGQPRREPMRKGWISGKKELKRLIPGIDLRKVRPYWGRKEEGVHF